VISKHRPLSAQQLPVANGSFASDLCKQQVKAEHIAGAGLSVWKRIEPRRRYQLRTADPVSSRELADGRLYRVLQMVDRR
jgi:hypothetical protein